MNISFDIFEPSLCKVPYLHQCYIEMIQILLLSWRSQSDDCQVEAYYSNYYFINKPVWYKLIKSHPLFDGEDRVRKSVQR